MTHPTIAEIDLNAVRANIRAIREKIGLGVRVMPIVKANAYGHGAAQVSRAVLDAGADMLGVACVAEAAILREAGIAAPILILGCSPADAVPDIVEQNVTATVCEIGFARALSAQAARFGKTARIHVKVDTGMGRIGTPTAQAASLIREISSLPGVEVEGVFTHFPSSDEDDSGFTAGQTAEFSKLLEELEREGLRPRIAHAANSGATLDHPNAYFDMIRPGIIMYGAYPSPLSSRSIVVTPALTFKTRVVFLKEIQAGTSVSYGRTFRAARKTTVATIPAGYADGFSRHLSNKGYALVRGQKAPIIGRVCMDQTLLDVTDTPGVQVGDEVILYGRQGDERISIEEIAELTGTVPHDVLCAIGPRVPRVYLGE